MYNGSVIMSVCVWCKACVYNGSVIMSVCVSGVRSVCIMGA